MGGQGKLDWSEEGYHTPCNTPLVQWSEMVKAHSAWTSWLGFKDWETVFFRLAPCTLGHLGSSLGEDPAVQLGILFVDPQRDKHRQDAHSCHSFHVTSTHTNQNTWEKNGVFFLPQRSILLSELHVAFPRNPAENKHYSKNQMKQNFKYLNFFRKKVCNHENTITSTIKK